MSEADLAALWLTGKLALVVTLLLLLIGLPLAWWLSRTSSLWRIPINALVAMPLVLPPTVLGFYLLILLGPQGAVGQWLVALGIDTLPFTFEGLVVASMVYSLPFVVQPLQNAMLAVDDGQLEAAATLRARPIDRFFSIVLPAIRPGIIAAAVLGFAHTVGEFGVVLMIGGNIPQETQVVSVRIYDHVEALDYGAAHWLSATLVAFSFLTLLAMYALQGRRRGAGFVPRF